MKPTDPAAEPRADGWFPHKGWWSEVTIGTVVAGRDGGRWQIIDARQGGNGQMFETPWFRAREMTTGAEYTMAPRPTKDAVTILTRAPSDTWTGHHEVSDADAIMLLVRELGATELATRDDRTGEVTCPDYVYDSHNGKIVDGLVEHMRIAHQMQVDDGLDIGELMVQHGHAHNRNSEIGKGGFPHRHVATRVY